MKPIAGYNLGRGPADIKPYLVVKLKRKWFYDLRRRMFVESSGKKFSPKEDLPKNTRIVYMTPDLAKKPMNSLLKDERDLVRYLQVILPKGINPTKYLPILKRWKCTEEVRFPPEISLP